MREATTTLALNTPRNREMAAYLGRSGLEGLILGLMPRAQVVLAPHRLQARIDEAAATSSVLAKPNKHAGDL
jgi:hypothetical protein